MEKSGIKNTRISSQIDEAVDEMGLPGAGNGARPKQLLREAKL
jgi:hypothetical protein